MTEIPRQAAAGQRRFRCFSRVRCAMIVGLVILRPPAGAAARPPKLPPARPEQLGMDSRCLDQIDRVVADGLKRGCMPGCVVAVGRQGRMVRLRAYGQRQVEPEPVPMTTDTLFDLASLTKPLATATSVMILVEQGSLGLQDRVGKRIPEFARNGKQPITVFQLLTHQGGLVADNPLEDYAGGPKKAWERIFALRPRVPPGSKFIYSDVGYMVLGELVRRVSGRGLDEFSAERIFRPLGMTETGFVPGPDLRGRAAPTEQRGGKWIRGEVHDPRAFRLGGIAGHAGLFSTAADLAVYAQMMLGGGRYAGVRVLDERTVAEMTRPRRVSAGLRGLGWDVRTGYSSNRPSSFSPQAFGHGGFTGTSLWIDPKLELFVIFLSNRLHPDGAGAVNPLAARIGAVAADAVMGADADGVLTGVDVLQREGFRLLAGRRVGLITNHTGLNRHGTSTAVLMHEAPRVELVALFSPEHGLEGKLDVAEIADARHAPSGLPVYSLYGKTRRPTPEMLRGIDTLVFDVQDVGTRFYTYISTLGYAMQAAAEQKLRFVVLDRPNPIGGVEVAGPVLDAGRESFVGFHRLPVRHGMTVGELARMFQAELRLGLDLEVVRLDRWQRSQPYDATGLLWVNPSPNMRSLTQALLYPGIGLLETTNLSVGRGTDTPFEVIGAPWLSGRRLASRLNRCGLPGVRFVPVAFTPESSKYAGERCEGVNLIVTCRDVFRPVHTGLEIARQLRAIYRESWDAEAYDRLLGNRRVHQALLAGKSLAEIEAIYRPGLEEFLRRRSRFLLYQ